MNLRGINRIVMSKVVMNRVVMNRVVMNSAVMNRVVMNRVMMNRVMVMNKVAKAEEGQSHCHLFIGFFLIVREYKCYSQ